MTKFILIGGMPRSGTNLTRRIIGSHSRIAIPPAEFRFFNQYAKGKGVAEILANERLERWGVELSDLCSRGHREAFIEALLRYAEHVGKEIAGEKTPRNEFYYDTIKEWLRDFELRFVHVVRNPIDTMASFKHSTIRHNKGRGGFPGLSAHSRNWVRSVSMALARAYHDAERYHVLKFEDLLADPISTTRELCAFLGVDFEQEQMLHLSDFEGRRDNTSFPQERRARHEEYGAIRQLESRKQYLTDVEIRTVSAICGELAHALGYEDDSFSSSPPEYPDSGIIGKLNRAVERVFRPG